VPSPSAFVARWALVSHHRTLLRIPIKVEHSLGPAVQFHRLGAQAAASHGSFNRPSPCAPVMVP
jgi:hypothetical protein